MPTVPRQLGPTNSQANVKDIRPTPAQEAPAPHFPSGSAWKEKDWLNTHSLLVFPRICTECKGYVQNVKDTRSTPAQGAPADSWRSPCKFVPLKCTETRSPKTRLCVSWATVLAVNCCNNAKISNDTEVAEMANRLGCQ